MLEEDPVDICIPVCDFCVHYNFNANERGEYTGNGRCEHPDHPRPMFPSDFCGDFRCEEHRDDELVWQKGQLRIISNEEAEKLREQKAKRRGI